MGDLVPLLFGCFAVIFNRFAADSAIEWQKKMSGIYPNDPVKAKRQGGLGFVAVGLFFIVTTLIQAYARNRANSASLDIVGPQRIIGGIGLLLVARGLVVDRRAAANLTTEQASEILNAKVSGKFGNYLVAVFVGVFVLVGATLITTGIQHL